MGENVQNAQNGEPGTGASSLTMQAISPAGFEVELTLTGISGGDVLKKAEGAFSWLTSHAYSPRPIPAAAVIPPVQAEAPAKGEPNAEGVLSDDKGKHYKVCETHQARMYEKTNKSGGSWFSHQLADGSWCKGGKA